jgi:hypothetical protein
MKESLPNGRWMSGKLEKSFGRVTLLGVPASSEGTMMMHSYAGFIIIARCMGSNIIS